MEFVPDSSDWYRATIQENTFQRDGYVFGLLNNGEAVFIARSNDVLKQYPIHLDCLPNGTQILVRMEKVQDGSSAPYRAIEAVIPGEPKKHETVEINTWNGKWGSAYVVECGCPIFILGKHGDEFNLRPGDIVEAHITLSRKTNNFIGVIYFEDHAWRGGRRSNVYTNPEAAA